MEHIKILDELLKFLSETEQTEFAYIKNEIDKKSDFLKDIDNSTLHSALLKLVKDGYVNQESKNSTDQLFNTPRTDHYYKISFEGIVYSNHGGYKNHYSKIQIKENELSNLKSQQSRHSTHLVRLTWIIAIGTLVAAVYYFLEILKFRGACSCG